jgi:hypothetical protein
MGDVWPKGIDTMNELINIEKINAIEFYSDSEKIDPLIEKIREEVKKHVADTTTQKGRDAIRSLAVKVRTAKTMLEDVGKKLVVDQKAEIAKVDKARIRVVKTLDLLQKETRQPLTDYENAETERKEKIELRLRELRETGTVEDFNANSLQIQEKLTLLESIPIDDSWDEYASIANGIRESGLENLKHRLYTRTEYENGQKELDRLKKEDEERRIRAEQERIKKEKIEVEKQREREAEERARQKIEEENRIKAEREQAEKDRIENENNKVQQRLIQEKEEADRKTKEAEEKAKRAESDARIKLEEEARLKKLAEDKKAADTENRVRVMNYIITSFLNCSEVSKEDAKKIALEIMQNKINHIKINY